MHHFGIDNLQPQTVQGGAPKIAVSWFTTPITMVHGRHIYSSEFISQLITRGRHLVVLRSLHLLWTMQDAFGARQMQLFRDRALSPSGFKFDTFQTSLGLSMKTLYIQGTARWRPWCGSSSLERGDLAEMQNKKCIKTKVPVLAFARLQVRNCRSDL